MIKVSIILLIITFQIQLRDGLAQTFPLDLRAIAESLDGASSMSITPNGLIYITEKKSHRFLVVTTGGERTDSLGALGSGDYRFNQPVSVDATNGLKIYVADQNNGRIQLFDRRFQYLSSITVNNIEQATRFRPSQLQVSSSGDLFAYDSDRHIIHVFDPLGNYNREIDLRNFNIGSDIHMKFSSSVLLIFDLSMGVVHKFTADGGYLNFIGGFSGAIKIHGTQSSIWAVFKDRVVQFSTLGEPLKTYRLDQQLMPEDLYIHQNRAFILLNEQLLKAQFE